MTCDLMTRPESDVVRTSKGITRQWVKASATRVTSVPEDTTDSDAPYISFSLLTVSLKQPLQSGPIHKPLFCFSSSINTGPGLDEPLARRIAASYYPSYLSTTVTSSLSSLSGSNLLSSRAASEDEIADA
jgi:hypothetical protein